MKEVILIKEGEIALKGLNRSNFEIRLLKNIKQRLKFLGNFKYEYAQSTLTIEPLEECDMQIVAEKISTVFGIASYSLAASAEKDFSTIKEIAKKYLKEHLTQCKTFKVEARRSDKKFPLKSPQICAQMGEVLINEFSNLTVDVHNPDTIVRVEIRDKAAYIYAKRLPGAGGIPQGCGGDGMLLISGGIDSPVAGWMMAKRGLKLQAVHFISPPYTSERALKKVEKLLSIMCKWCDCIPFHCVNFTEFQEEIRKKCPNDLFTIIMRRMMMKIAQKIIKNQNTQGYCNIQTMVTGESLGQVASQTLGAMVCTDAACNMPVLRPLIGMDKSEIVNIAKDIDTFETSILPYEDCCTVFTPKHPKTKPRLSDIERAESKLNVDELIQKALEKTKFYLIREE